MAGVSNAVFLSYASEDAEAAGCVAEALRTAGIEVWFDQSELRGGEAWDRQIRKQIHDCALFIPVISANAHARVEGYFRLEWKLAVDRSHLMAPDQTFLVPVVIDSTPQGDERIPDRFRELQWSRLPDGHVPPAFIEHVQRLLSPLQSEVLTIARPVTGRLSTAASTAGMPLRASRGPKRLLLVASVLVILGSLASIAINRLWTAKHPAATPPVASASQTAVALAPPPRSIAVLAFSDLSAEGNQGYFADGIAEEILNVLAHVKGLKLASRTSSFQFRKSDLGTTAIAQKLGVRHILEGSVRKAGDNVRVTAQLIDASTDQHEWSQSFDRPLSTANLFAIQDEIAKNIVDHIGATMGGATDIVEPVVRKADTTDVDAYDLYLKGRALFIARSKGNLSEAARVLKTVVAKDPGFARAWETLAAVLVVSRGWGLVEERDYNQAALDAADRALRLNPRLSLAYAVRGRAQTNMIPNGDKVSWDESLTDFSEAIRRDAQNATVLLWLGQSYATLGFQDRAAENYERCLKIDPAYEICRRYLALTYLYIGRADDALRLYEMGLARGYMADAEFAPAAVARGDRLGALGMLAEQCQDQPQLIQPLFRALTDATFSETDRQEALSLVDKKNDDPDRVLLALWILKAYDQMTSVGADFPTIFWARDDAAWLKSSGRKKMMHLWRLPDYWRKHGFPPQCRPIGESDFECR